jgi:serine/threonine protein kinase
VRGILGEGGMGIVYLAWDHVTRRDVALKYLHADGLGDGGLARLREELHAVEGLVHPSIVRTYTIEDDGAAAFLVLERLSGKTLAAASRERRLNTDEAVRIVSAVLDALAAAHRRGIAHRDVKPSNVVLCDDGRVVLLDFGIAHRTTLPLGDATNDVASTISGTPGYMAPEVILGRRAGPPADVYAVGVMLHELLTGKPLFAGTAAAMFASHVSAAPPVTRRGPRWVREAVRAMLAKDPAARPVADAALDRRQHRATMLAAVGAIALAALAWIGVERLRGTDYVVIADRTLVGGFGNPAAVPHVRVGTEAYQSGRYADAVDAFEKAYALSARPEIVFNLAQAHRMSGDVAGARDLLVRYRAMAPMSHWIVIAGTLRRLESFDHASTGQAR